MSYLDLPRLTFIGESYSNPSTGNNNDLADIFDVDTLEFRRQMQVIPGGQMISPPVNALPWEGPEDNSELRNWMMGLMKTPPDIDEGGEGQPAHWNYYGDHATEFRRAFVNCVSLRSGRRSEDVILGAKVEILGDIYYEDRKSPVIVDIDPYALITSQIFIGQLRVSKHVDGQDISLIEGDRPTRAFSYHIDPYKNLDPHCYGFQAVSAIFIFAIPKEHLTFNRVTSSPALAELRKEVEAGLGLQVRFCFYNAVYKLQAGELHARYARGEYVFNPYEGRVLGSIGPWRQGELATAPPGRKLYVQETFPYAAEPERLPLARVPLGAVRHHYRSVAERRIERAIDPTQKSRQIRLGPTLASVDRQRKVVTLDLISTFPEESVITLEKARLGDMSLHLIHGNGRIDLGSIPYARRSYEQGGGVAEIQYGTHAQLDEIERHILSGRFAVFSEALHQDLLTEVPTIDVQTDERGVYVDAQIEQGGTFQPGTTSITIHVLQRGEPKRTETAVNLEYWMCDKNYVNPNKPQVNVPQKFFDVSGAISQPPTEYRNPLPRPGDPDKIQVITDQVTVPAGGELTLELIARRPGVSMIRFVDPTLRPVPVPNFAWDNTDFAIVRVLPHEDFSGCSDQTINSWPFIYEHFFGYFSVLYPIMSKVVPWGPDNAPNDPAEVKKLAEAIRNFTSEEMWDSTLYMPISRDLTAGRRKLIHRWCNLQM